MVLLRYNRLKNILQQDAYWDVRDQSKKLRTEVSDGVFVFVYKLLHITPNLKVT